MLSILMSVVLLLPALYSPVRWQPTGLHGVLVHRLVFRGSMGIAAAYGGVYVLGNGHWRRVLAAQDVWDVAFGPGVVIAGEESGTVDVSPDARHWLRRPLGGAVYAVTVRPGYPRQMLAGAAGGIWSSRDGGVHWRRVLGLPGGAAAAFTWSGRLLYAGTVAGVSRGPRSVLLSTDGGSHWRVFGREVGGGIMSLAARGRRVYAGTMGFAVWASPAGISSWRVSAAGMPRSRDHVAGLLVAGRHLYAATLGWGVYRSADGRHWTRLATGLGQTGGIVLGLAYHAGTLWAATANGLYGLSLPSP